MCNYAMSSCRQAASASSLHRHVKTASAACHVAGISSIRCHVSPVTAADAAAAAAADEMTTATAYYSDAWLKPFKHCASYSSSLLMETSSDIF